MLNSEIEILSTLLSHFDISIAGGEILIDGDRVAKEDLVTLFNRSECFREHLLSAQETIVNLIYDAKTSAATVPQLAA